MPVSQDIYDALKAADAAGDTASASKLAAYIQTQDAAPVASMQEKPTFVESMGRGMMDMAQGAKQGWLQGDELTRAHEAAASKITGQNTQRPPNDISAADYTNKVNDEVGLYEQGRGPEAGFDAGRMAGQVAATAPMMTMAPGAGAGLAARMGAAALQGGAQGAAEFDPTGENRGTNIATGAAVGGALPAIGAGIKATIGSAKGAMKAGTNRLIELAKQYNIPLDAAQQTGRMALEHLKAVTGKFPFSGAAAFERKQKDALNKAMAGTFGQELPDGQFSSQIMTKAAERMGEGFEKVAAGKAVDVTPRMHQVLREIEAGNDPKNSLTFSPKVAELVQQARAQFDGRQKISGEMAQNLRSEISQLKNDAAKAGEPKRVLDAYRDIRDAVDASIEDVLSPGDLAAWKTAKSQYGNFKTVSQALASSAGDAGDVSGPQLWNAIGGQVGRRNMARAGGDLKDIAELAKDVMKSKVSDSGTSQRLLYQSLFPAAGGLIGAHEGGADTKHIGAGVLGGAATAALTSRVLRNQMVAKALRNGLIPSSPEGAQIASILRRYGLQPAAVAETNDLTQ